MGSACHSQTIIPIKKGMASRERHAFEPTVIVGQAPFGRSAMKRFLGLLAIQAGGRMTLCPNWRVNMIIGP
jgi:hypothetical protein